MDVEIGSIDSNHNWSPTSVNWSMCQCDLIGLVSQMMEHQCPCWGQACLTSCSSSCYRPPRITSVTVLFLRSLRMGTGWCSSSSSWAGPCTGTHPSPSAPSSSWSDRWTSGRRSMTEERVALWSTACKFPSLHHSGFVKKGNISTSWSNNIGAVKKKNPFFLRMTFRIVRPQILMLNTWVFPTLNSFSVTTGMEAAAVEPSVPSVSCVRCCSTRDQWMFSTLWKHWEITNPTWWTCWWEMLEN